MHVIDIEATHERQKLSIWFNGLSYSGLSLEISKIESYEIILLQ